ncbi:MAG TPA: hypothetical protein VGL72_33095 [Bryobacteraceae bacterium]|jgi:hypothetical protein
MNTFKNRKERPVKKRAKILSAIISTFVLFGAALAVARRGLYGWSLFVVIPLIAGGFSSLICRPKTLGKAFQIGVATGTLGCALFLFLGLEGFICALMALPIVVLLTTVGSLLVYYSGTESSGKHPTALALLLPVSFFYDVNAKPPVYAVETSIIVNAPPDRVWKNAVAFPDIPDRPDWVLRTGLAYPIRTRIAGAGLGAPRNCDLSTGTVEERVTVWDPPKRLQFVVTATPPAMREMGLYGPIHPKHLNGYYISKEGRFELTPLAGNRTLVTGTSWYQHGLWPARYWRWWADIVVHHIHQRVLNHIRALSETP